MKKILSIFSILVMSLFMTSCLESNLDDLPSYTDAEITDVKFEYRYIGQNIDSDQLFVKQLKVSTTIDSDNATVTVDITVPEADNVLTEEEREKVSLTNLVCYFYISTAAEVKSAEIPLGVPSDFSAKEAKYTIMAADGSTKDWTLIINSFTK